MYGVYLECFGPASAASLSIAVPLQSAFVHLLIAKDSCCDSKCTQNKVEMYTTVTSTSHTEV